MPARTARVSRPAFEPTLSREAVRVRVMESSDCLRVCWAWLIWVAARRSRLSRRDRVAPTLLDASRRRVWSWSSRWASRASSCLSFVWAALRAGRRFGRSAMSPPVLRLEPSTTSVVPQASPRGKLLATSNARGTRSRAGARTQWRSGRGRRHREAIRTLLGSLVDRSDHEGGEESAEEAARVAPVVHPGSRDQSENEEDERPRAVLAQHGRAEEAAAASSVPDHGGEETKDGPRGAHRIRRSHQIGDEEAHHSAHCEDDHGARLSVHLLDVGHELAHPEQVEQDMEQAAVEVDGGEHGPPVSLLPRDCARHAERGEGAPARGEDVEDARSPDGGARVEGEGGDVGDHGHHSDQSREVEPADQAPDTRPESPQPRIAPSAVEAHGGIGAVELAAGVAEA